MRCFKGWVWYVGHCKRSRQALAYMVNGSKMKSMRAWKHFTRESFLKRERTKNALAFWTNAACRSCLLTWSLQTKAKVKARRQLNRANAYLRNAREMRIVTAWKAYIEAQRKKVKCAMQVWVGSTLKHAFREWHSFFLSESVKRKAITKVQACIRGKNGREYADELLYKMHWAATLVQNQWRGRKGILQYKKMIRLKDLHEYLKEEKETNIMMIEDELSAGMRRAWDAAKFVQRVWKGRLGKIHFREYLIAHVRKMALLAKEKEKEARQEAEERQNERMLVKWNQNVNAIRIQNFVRCTFARMQLDERQEEKREIKYSTLIQAGYRGRMARRTTASIMRVKELKTVVRVTVHRRNAAYFRIFGLKMRRDQRIVAQILDAVGLLPSSFLMTFRELLKEINLDYNELKRGWDEFNDVLWNAKRDDVQIVNMISFLPAIGELVDYEKEMEVRKKWSAIIFELFGVNPTDCVKVVYAGHERHGETGFVLSIDRDSKIAEIRFDVDGQTEFIPLCTEQNEYQDEVKTLVKIKPIGFHHVKETTKMWAKLAEDDAVAAKTQASAWKRSLLALAQWEKVLRRDFVNSRRSMALLIISHLLLFPCSVHVILTLQS